MHLNRRVNGRVVYLHCELICVMLMIMNSAVQVAVERSQGFVERQPVRHVWL